MNTDEIVDEAMNAVIQEYRGYSVHLEMGMIRVALRTAVGLLLNEMDKKADKPLILGGTQ